MRYYDQPRTRFKFLRNALTRNIILLGNYRQWVYYAIASGVRSKKLAVGHLAKWLMQSRIERADISLSLRRAKRYIRKNWKATQFG